MSSTVSLTIEAPEQVEAPYRWPTKRYGDAPFPHACVKTKTGEIEYQLARSRQTSRTSWGDFYLSLQVYVGAIWEDCKDSLFEPLNSLCAAPWATFLPDNSIEWVIDEPLKLLKTPPDFSISESGYVRHPYCKPVAEHGLSIAYDGSKRVRLFRFKAVGKGRNENKGQYYEAYVSLRPSKSAFTLRPFFHPGSERARMRLARHLSTTARSSRQAEPAADLPREVRTREVFFYGLATSRRFCVCVCFAHFPGPRSRAAACWAFLRKLLNDQLIIFLSIYLSLLALLSTSRLR